MALINHSKLEESKTIKQQIIEEIQSMLKEQAYTPVDDTTGIAGGVPSAHKSFLQQLVKKAKAKRFNSKLTQVDALKALDQTLKNGYTTDEFYQKMIKIYSLDQSELDKKPANFSYTQGGASAKGKTPAPSKSTSPSKPTSPRYFVCKIPEEIQATRDFQTSKDLNPDGKIGKNTYAAILADPSVLSGGKPFAQKGIKFKEVLGLIDPKMKKIHQRSVCEALAGTAAARITGANPDAGTDPTSKYGPTLQKLKCPSFIKPTGPYAFEEIQKYIPNYLQDAQKNDDSLIFAIASAVTNAAKRSPSVGCEELIGFIQGAIKTKGRSVPGLSKIETPEQDAKSYELDKLNAARTYASQGMTAGEVGDPEVVAVGKKYDVFKESKNWLDRTRETTASNLFERLVRDTAKK